jgi:NADH-quinone oxidoreductase subunit E
MNEPSGCFDVVVDFGKVDQIIDKYGRDQTGILGMFQDIQREYRYLPKEAIAHVCKTLGVPLAKGYEVATFFKALSLKPRGKYTIQVCLGTACHLKGGPNVIEQFERELSVKTGDTTANKRFTLESVNCLGACALAPLVRVDEKDFGKTTPGTVKKVVKAFTGE